MTEKILDGRRLLVVEDDPGICELLQACFRGAGAEVDLVFDGAEATAAITDKQPDLVVLDVVLPHHDGFAILEEIRRLGSRVPVIMLTDQAAVDDKVRGLTTGADDYVTKPFSTRELMARVAGVLRRLEPDVEARQLRLGTVVMNLAAREVVMEDGTRVQFTKTEFDLVAFLGHRRGQAVSHKNLLEQVMGYRGDIETKALVMHIANIRRKLLKYEIDDVKIETVAGVGYKLVVPGD